MGELTPPASDTIGMLLTALERSAPADAGYGERDYRDLATKRGKALMEAHRSGAWVPCSALRQVGWWGPDGRDRVHSHGVDPAYAHPTWLKVHAGCVPVYVLEEDE